MTAATFVGSRAEPEVERRLPLAPAEGWATLALVVAMSMTLGWSIADYHWVLGPPGLTDFLPWLMALGVGWGFLSAKVGWPRWLAHLLGAVSVSLILPLIVGSLITPRGAGLGEWYRATAAAVVNAFLDVTYRNLPFTTETGHYMVVLGILCWGTAQYAGYVVFHHRRPLNAVIVVGAGLVLHMSIINRDQLMLLVVFSIAALFLLIRYHAFDEHVLWIRHRIGDATPLGGLYLRGGTVFISAAVIGALFLTNAASSNPLGSVWKGTDKWLIDIGRQLERVFRSGGAGTRVTAIDFGPSFSILQTWVTDSTEVLRIEVPDNGQYYWRAVTYDHFDAGGRSWSWSGSEESDVGAGGDLLAATGDDPRGLQARREVTFSVQELANDPQAIYAPDTPDAVDVDTKLTTVGGPDAYFGGVTGSTDRYQVSSLVPLEYDADHPDGLTANKLKVAGTDYPAGLLRHYAPPVDPTTIGPRTRELLDEIHAKYPDADKPYDLADAIKTYLRDPNLGGFHYDSDVSEVNCGDAGVVECFAATRQGFCMHYASTMAILLRIEGIPSRLAMGYLPGERHGRFETIRHSGAHAWVEVFFPGYGWVKFDPTGNVGLDAPLPAGPVVTAAPSTSKPSLGPNDTGEQRRSFQPAASGGAPAGGVGGGPGRGPLIAIGLLLGITVLALAYAAWVRGPRSSPEPDAVYGGLVNLARRFGFAPRPSQTVFEYADALGEVLPKSRPDLQVVANAKVEVAYGRRVLGDDRLRSLRDAQRRLRVALLRLLFRRRHRKGARTT